MLDILIYNILWTIIYIVCYPPTPAQLTPRRGGARDSVARSDCHVPALALPALAPLVWGGHCGETKVPALQAFFVGGAAPSQVSFYWAS